MIALSKSELEEIRRRYSVGTKVKLIFMNDPYATNLLPGAMGTVFAVDDIGTIHVHWECGSSLGVVYGEDICEPVNK